jgi:hypothetical protein
MKAHIKSKKMPDPKTGLPWDGTPDVVKFPQRVGPAALREWSKDWYEFGRRVRRDIFVLEKLLVDRGVDPAELFGDPGDPPPDPEI